MNIYTNTSRWKLILFLAGLCILIIPWFLTNYIAKKLEQSEHRKMEIYARTMEELTKSTEGQVDYTYHQSILESFKDIPILALNDEGKIVDVINYGTIEDTVKVLKEFQSSGIPPIESFGYARFIYYKHPFTLTLLKFFPLAQLILLLLYALIGYGVFNTSRREEQNRVWVGMAKETAHQLGTPISGIVGWIENLKLGDDLTQNHTEIIKEMEADVLKLQQVADRFSKIGSKPELKSSDLVLELSQVIKYIEARAPKTIHLNFSQSELINSFYVHLNSNLFQWVIENLLRNSLDAMDGNGTIDVTVFSEPKTYNIEIKDSGHGIAPNKLKTIFKPGYTTKTRGWGLGLSLAKRIIENYHNGKIFVKESEIGKGTTFVIELNKKY